MLKKVEDNQDYEKYFALTRPEMQLLIPKSSKKILEVGCGAGYFGSEVKAKIPCEYWGIEPFEEAAHAAAKSLDKVLNVSIDQAFKELPTNYFDCLVFNDVLEHLANPFDVLEKFHSILQDGAKIVSSIPNVRYAGNLKELLVNKDWEYKHEGGILDFTHLRFFTKKSIIRMFEQTGFKILSINGINPIPNYKFLPVNLLTLGLFNDSKYLQFSVLAEKSLKT